ncbi:hypothetical protein NC651_040008 [Populus alba x Populus x berolinensis]|nr:hypothetical protein NC651_040008 [Populus alba x Populus x berolinensis]
MHDLQGDHDMKNKVKGGNIHGQQKKRRGYGNPKCMASRCCPCFAVSSIARRIGRCLFVWSNLEFLSLYHVNEEKKFLYDSLVYLFIQGSYDQAALIFGFSTCTVLYAYCLDRDMKEKEKKRKRFGGCIRDRLNLGKLNTWGCEESKLLGKGKSETE